MPVDRETLIGRVGLDRRTQQIADVLADPDYGRQDLQRVGGIPHHHGCADAARRRGRRRARRLAQRGRPVRRAGDGDRHRVRRARRRWRSTASSSCSSSRPAAPSWPTRSTSWRRCARSARPSAPASTSTTCCRRSPCTPSSCRTPTAARSWSTTRRTAASWCAASTGPSPSVVERLRAIRIDLDETLVGRAAKERRPIAVPGPGAVDLDPHLRILYDDGWRSLVAVPMLREGTDRRRRSSSGGSGPATSRRRRSSCWRRSRASPRWRSSTPGCSASSRSRAPSWRWPAGTSRSSSPACRTSCARR